MKFKFMVFMAVVGGYFALFVEPMEAQSYEGGLYGKANFGLGVLSDADDTGIVPQTSINLGFFFNNLTGIYFIGSYGVDVYRGTQNRLPGLGMGIIRLTGSKNKPYVYAEVCSIQRFDHYRGYKGIVGGGLKFARYFSIDLSLSYAASRSHYIFGNLTSIFLALSAWTF